MASTTNIKVALWAYRKYLGSYCLHDAGGKIHCPIGIGYLFVPTTNDPLYMTAFYTPTLPVTIISPKQMVTDHSFDCYNLLGVKRSRSTAPTIILEHLSDPSLNMMLPLSSHSGMTFMAPLLLPNIAAHTSPLPTVDSSLPHPHGPTHTATIAADASLLFLDVKYLNTDMQHILWHQRLGHIHHRRLFDLHKSAIGIPNVNLTGQFDKCLICLCTKVKCKA
jgi:GAG-pre-integrase domain